MLKKNNCTIVVSSCDNYEDTWYPFFKILEEQWPDRPYPIVLNTESKSFDYEDMDIMTFNFYKSGQKIQWGKRLIKTLENIDSEYIVFLLDDFFLLDRVDQKRIDECLDWMNKDKNIAVFSFWRTHQPNIKDNKYPHFEKRPQEAEYRLNCQAAVWRREKLISYIRPHENPWQWELLGSKRSSRYKEDFYSAIEGEPYIFVYDWFSGGGVHRGKWTKNIEALFEKHGIEIDYSRRGFESNDIIKENVIGLKKVNKTMKSLIYKLNNILTFWKSLR